MKKEKTKNIIISVFVFMLFSLFGFLIVMVSQKELSKNDKEIFVAINDGQQNNNENNNTEEINLGDCAAGHYYCESGSLYGQSCYSVNGSYKIGCQGQNIGGQCYVQIGSASYVCDQYGGDDDDSESSSSSSSSSSATPKPTATPKVVSEEEVGKFLFNVWSAVQGLVKVGRDIMALVVSDIGAKTEAFFSADSDCKLSVTINAGHVSKGDTVRATITYSNCKSVSVYSTNLGGAGGSYSGSGAQQISGTVDDACATVTVGARGDGGATASASVSATNTKTTWYETSNPNVKPKQFSADSANEKGQDVYGTDCNVLTGVCDHVYTRGSCGYGYEDFTPTGPSEEGGGPSYACFADAPTLDLATSTTWATASSSKYPFLISGVGEADCVVTPPPPSLCVPTDDVKKVREPKSPSANVCEDTINVSEKSEYYPCDGDSYIDITCDTDTKTEYNFDDNCLSASIPSNIYKGQGFKFGVYITTTRTCKATFDRKAWLSNYNQINETIARNNALIDAYKDSNLKREYESQKNEMQHKKEEMENIVRKYNNFYNERKYEGEYDEGTYSRLDISVNGVTVGVGKIFERVELNSGSGKFYSKTENELGVSGLENPYNFEWSNRENPRKVKLIPSVTYIDRITGKETPSSDGLAGGNKIYTDPDTDVGVYTLNVTTQILDGSSSVEKDLTNNKCTIKVNDKTLLYRPIDVANPFISKTWNKGENWINTVYDFTGTIHANTWSGNSLYDIELSTDMISKIQRSNTNKRNDAPYLGLCEKEDVTLQDEATKYICSQIK